MARHRATILVADDDPAMREVLEMRLLEWGYNVLLAEDGSQAAEIAEANRPDLILTDLVMPRVSGIELLQRLKASSGKGIVVLITAEGTVDVAVEAMKHGAYDFVVKPLDYPRLRTILDAARVESER